MKSFLEQGDHHAAVDNKRIAFLDGLRGIAIIMVALFHYYSRFAGGPISIYPFSNAWANNPIAAHGNYGVQLFFAVSGFVIVLTLMRCASVTEFAVRRFARLWPTMLLCSVLTFVFLLFYPVYFSKHFSDFLPSLTFIDGEIYERLIPGSHFTWIDGAYWSLFVEVRFYVITAVLYFSVRKAFFGRLLAFCVFSIVSYWALHFFGMNGLARIFAATFIPGYLPWFLIGVAAYAWSIEKYGWAVTFSAVAIGKVLISAMQNNAWDDVLVAGCIIAVFLGCFCLEWMRKAFSMRWLAGIGVASYSLYLLHQNVGVTLTALLAKAWSLYGISSSVIPLLVFVCMVGLARLVWKYWETPLNRRFVYWFMSRQVKHVAVSAPVSERAA